MAGRSFSYPQDVLWTMRDKTQIRLGDMEDSHIANCIRMLRRKAERHMDNCAWGYSYPGNPDSMGSYYAEIEADQEGNRARECDRVIDIFMDELKRRHPNVRIHICRDDERLPRLRL